MAPRESITSAAVENLDLSIRDLADQLQVLREVLDEIREYVSYAPRIQLGSHDLPSTIRGVAWKLPSADEDQPTDKR